jgi:hypothetical protein
MWFALLDRGGSMAHMQVKGPYRVQPPTEGHPKWEIVEMVDGQPVQLRPRVTYEKEKRTSAYRRLALMNRKWQRTQGSHE